MFQVFNFSPRPSYGGKYNQYVEIGRELFDETNSMIKTDINSFVLKNGHIDGTQLTQNWFPSVKADIFLSHSHKDIEKVKGLAGWLYEKFHLVSFIDSCVWGYCDELLKTVDDEYCWQPQSKTYNYTKRNYTTSHIHIMLASALTEMIDQCECAIFYNTPNSISVHSELEKVQETKSDVTLSPWIYHELSVLSTIKRRKPERKHIIHSDSIHQRLMEAQKELEVEYDVSNQLKQMQTLTDEMFCRWEKTVSQDRHPLDTLYEIAFRQDSAS